MHTRLMSLIFLFFLTALTGTATAQQLPLSPAPLPVAENLTAVAAPTDFDPTRPRAKSDDPSAASSDAPGVADPLVRILARKGVLTANDLLAISAAPTPAGQRDLLVSLLMNKGVLSSDEVAALRATDATPRPTQAALRIPARPAADATERTVADIGDFSPTSDTQAFGGPAALQGAKPEAPKVIPAIAPIRALQIEPSKREGLIPDLKIGNNIRVKLFGFFKTSVTYDSSQPQGIDFPLPGFLGDSGPSGSPNFHLKSRAFRFGANFEWIDPSPKTSITGRFELDFEGNFARVANRNIGSIRSNAPSLRLAWVRIDRALTEKLSAFALFGQDWTPFASSTLPNLIETTGLGIGFGTLYDRTPQVKTGVSYNVGGSRGLRFTPEFAITLPAFGNLPADAANQLAFGERQGGDSARPEFMGRFVTQFQLDKAPGVVPAQFIVSFMQARRTAIVRAGDVPAAYRAAFPTGAELSSSRYGYTVEAQMPTRFVTILAKYWNGQDLRRFFSGQLYSEFNDTAGMTATATGTSIDGASTVVFGTRNGVATVAPQRPVRQQGGFFNLGFPLSRIFHANPEGRNAGWSAYLHYGYDQALARDARRFAGPRGKGDLFAANVQYKLNSFVTFAFEQSYYRTRSANATSAAQNGLPLFRGVPAMQTQNVRSEFATIFTF
jgi:hypothetical protein